MKKATVVGTAVATVSYTPQPPPARRPADSETNVAARLAEEHLLVELAQGVDRLLVLVGPTVLVRRAQRRVEAPLACRVDEEGAEVAVVDPEDHGSRTMPTLLAH